MTNRTHNVIHLADDPRFKAPPQPEYEDHFNAMRGLLRGLAIFSLLLLTIGFVIGIAVGVAIGRF